MAKGRKMGNQYTGTKPLALACRKRDAEAIKLRLEGKTLQEISDALGFASKTHARLGILRGMKVLAPPDNAEQMRQLEVGRSYEIEQEAWEQWYRSVGDAVRVVTKEAAPEVDGVQQKPIPTEIVTTREGQSGNPALLEKILKAVELRAKLLGLYAPENINIDQRTDVRVIGCNPQDVLENALRKIKEKSS